MGAGRELSAAKLELGVARSDLACSAGHREVALSGVGIGGRAVGRVEISATTGLKSLSGGGGSVEDGSGGGSGGSSSGEEGRESRVGKNVIRKIMASSPRRESPSAVQGRAGREGLIPATPRRPVSGGKGVARDGSGSSGGDGRSQGDDTEGGRGSGSITRVPIPDGAFPECAASASAVVAAAAPNAVGAVAVLGAPTTLTAPSSLEKDLRAANGEITVLRRQLAHAQQQEFAARSQLEDEAVAAAVAAVAVEDKEREGGGEEVAGRGSSEGGALKAQLERANRLLEASKKKTGRLWERLAQVQTEASVAALEAERAAKVWFGFA